ncbi:hypothetical protein K435DRAFT_879892 [Dendrothele bispora CBS 962.96]|uniref:N-acetyltransferase domain-containing protein n=1 Tax=Dendrothele bispora (strain CBS 962.96) TaxID=1314807 RepID=A0A4S8KKK5_DENBC|nr:hypothetical protein K435DRAFT_879892 [Dendrothele bispora CBS 962.96]
MVPRLTIAEDELTRVSRNLAAAFSEDPLAHAILGEWPSNESELAIDFFKAHILAGLSNGAVYTVGEDIPALVVAFGPGKEMDDEFPQWKDVIGRVPEANRLWRVNEFKVQYEDFIGKAYGVGRQRDSWYIMLLGVEISKQKHGLGTTLAEEGKVPLCWQTTTAPEFYGALGFEAVEKIRYLAPFGIGTVTQWAYISRPSTE